MTPIAGFAAQGNVHMLQVESKGRLGTVKDFMQIHQRVQDELIMIWSGMTSSAGFTQKDTCTCQVESEGRLGTVNAFMHAGNRKR